MALSNKWGWNVSGDEEHVELLVGSKAHLSEFYRYRVISVSSDDRIGESPTVINFVWSIPTSQMAPVVGSHPVGGFVPCIPENVGNRLHAEVGIVVRCTRGLNID